MFKNHVQKHHINPRFRAYGKARIDIAQRAHNRDDWFQLWKEPSNPFPFAWGENWKQSIEYKVDDFAAEVGFFIDILGFPVNAFDPDYAMFTSPDRDFYFSIIPTYDGEESTPPEALRIQFMVADIFEVVEELQKRGVIFDQEPLPCEDGSTLYIAFFRTPHGICVDLWGFADHEVDEQEIYGEDFTDDLMRQDEKPPENELPYGLISERSDNLHSINSKTSEEDLDEEVEGFEEDEQQEEQEGDDQEDSLDESEEEPRYVFDDDEESNSLWKIRYS